MVSNIFAEVVLREEWASDIVFTVASMTYPD